MAETATSPTPNSELRSTFVIQFSPDGRFVAPDAPKPDGMAYVAWDQNKELPAYQVAKPDGGDELVPFAPTIQFPPPNYSGRDFYLDEFTDAKLRERWHACKSNTAKVAEVLEHSKYLRIPHQYRVTGAVDRNGLVDPHDQRLDLHQIRRPSYFSRQPFAEAIAAADGRTWIVDFEAPAELHERIHMNRSNPVRLRGWYMEGRGIDDGRGGRTRALVVLTGGRSIETTATQDPKDAICEYDSATKRYLYAPYPVPGGHTEIWGMRSWRNYLFAMNEAGFDVLTLDKRGHGISGGYNDSNMGEQARDLFRALDALETGVGLRLLSPDGVLLEGDQAKGRLLAGQTARQIPVVLGGSSQGAIVTAWGMHFNFVEDPEFDSAQPGRRPPLRYNVKGAMVLASFAAGVGFRSAEAGLVEAACRVEFNVQAMPSSEILANIQSWPAVFVGRGLWDFGESLEGAFETYRRAKGLKDIVVVRGPHGENEWGEDNIRIMHERMVKFSKAAVLGQSSLPGAIQPRNLRELVASSPPYWEATSAPK